MMSHGGGGLIGACALAPWAISAGRCGLLCRASPVGQRARCDRDESVVSTCCVGRRVRCVVYVNVNQPGAREDVWQARPGGDGSPAARDAGGSGRLAVWFTGGCCAPVTVRARPVRVDRVGGPRRHARGDGGDLCGVFHLDSVDGAAPRVGGRPASGTYTAGAGSPASNACVGDGAVVEVASSPVPAAGWSSGCGSGAACVAGC